MLHLQNYTLYGLYCTFDISIHKENLGKGEIVVYYLCMIINLIEPYSLSRTK